MNLKALLHRLPIVALALGILTAGAAAQPNTPNVTLTASTLEACDGDVVTITATVTHSVTGDPVTCGNIHIQRRVNGVFNSIEKGAPDANGQFSVTFDTTGFAGECLVFRGHFTPGGGGNNCPGGTFNANNGAHLSVCVSMCDAVEGCSHGYWKNHEAAWGDTGYAAADTIGGVFAGNLGGVDGGTSLRDALDFQGGSGVDGKRRLLLMQAVAALLNAAHPDVVFPLTVQEVLDLVEAALDSDDAEEIEARKDDLDEMNNLGCPLS
jgi:hypothetical protein